MGEENRGRRLSCAGTTDTRVLQNSSRPPKDQPIPWAGEGEGNQRASTSVEELSHLRNLQLAQHITCVGMRNTKPLGRVWLRTPFPMRRAPSLIRHHQLQASGLELTFLWAQIHSCFLSRNLSGFMCAQILHFNVAYWPFRYFVFLFWSEKSVCWFHVLLLPCCWENFWNQMAGKMCEVLVAAERNQPAPVKNGSVKLTVWDHHTAAVKGREGNGQSCTFLTCF